ncbi:RDD family protein [Bacillus coahuilensis]|uniref:RDD family protein n=1 Tax=Bacillus coahuilensis TaxID=408580 RepID=UPI000A56624C|nr:RDD family protein [Bacillus coahuilensis]
MNQPQIEVKTPEYVSLQFQPAGLGSRAAALIIDQTIMGLTNLLLLFLAFFLLSGEPSLFWLSTLPSYLFGIVIVVVFLINWGYFVFLEYYWSGKTVGKSMVGVRVIQQNGHSITLLSSMIRNLLRIIDTLPAAYFIGILMVFFLSTA